MTEADYTQALEEFAATQEGYQVVKEQIARLEEGAELEYKKLYDAYENLKQLRHNQLFALLEEQGLGICSAEQTPQGLNLKHQDIKKADELAKLGLFPLGKLRLVYCYNRKWSRGHYEEFSYELHYLFQLCPHHYPKPTRNRNLPYWSDVIKKKGSQEYIDKQTGQLLPKETERLTNIPDKVFEYFQIPPLPEKP